MAQGSRNWDYKAANENLGIKGKSGKVTIGAHKHVHGDVVWHHVSYDPDTNTAVMQLVTTKDHNASKPHKGSVKDYEVATGTEYESAAAKKRAKGLNAKCH